MISTKLQLQVTEIDEVIHDADPDFPQTGLKLTSLVRVTRLAVVSAGILHEAIGSVTDQRFNSIRLPLAQWISGALAPGPGENEDRAEQQG
jgi:mRNA interferase MazF